METKTVVFYCIFLNNLSPCDGRKSFLGSSCDGRKSFGGQSRDGRKSVWGLRALPIVLLLGAAGGLLQIQRAWTYYREVAANSNPSLGSCWTSVGQPTKSFATGRAGVKVLTAGSHMFV